MRIIETEPSEQDNKSAESGERAKTGCSTVRGEDRECEDIFDTVSEYAVTENEEVKIHEGDFFILCSC